MNIEQKVEIINLFASADYKKRLDQQVALGWEVVSTSVNDTILGKEMVVTFKRNKNLRQYDKFVELDNKIDKIRSLIADESNNSVRQAEKDLKTLPFLGAFSALLLFGLILFDIYIVIASINSFKDFSGGKLVSLVIFLVLAVSGHWLQRKLAKKIKRRISGDPINDKVKKYEAQIEMIIEEAKSLDYSLNDGVK